MKKPVILNLHGNEIELRFTMSVWERLEDEICTLEEFQKRMQQKGRLRLIAQVAAILAQDAQPEITAEFIFNSMRPADLRTVSTAVMQAITNGLSMDEKADGENVRDAVLDEIESKKEKAV